MKIRLILALGLLVAVVISCQCIGKQSGHGVVQIDKHSVLIPGTAISSADQAALNKIFAKYDSLLYRVGVYDKGSFKKQLGTMEDIQLGDIATEYANNATASGLTSWINQIGARTHVTHYPPTTHVAGPGSPSHVTTSQPSHVTTGQTTHVTTGEPTHVTTPRPTHVTHNLDKQSDALVKEVTPILEKYSK